jgi:hypothetical protein
VVTLTEVAKAELMEVLVSCEYKMPSERYMSFCLKKPVAILTAIKQSALQLLD